MAIKATVYGLAKTKKDIDINEQFRSLMTEVDGTGAVVIDGKNIAADSIYANQIKAGQINADHLRTDAITADHIQVGVVTGDKIKTGILESNNNLSWLNMDDGTFSFGGGRLTYNQNKLSITAEELYIGTSPVVTNDQLNKELDKIESPDFENKVVDLSGNPIFTDKADDNSLVHVEVDGKSVGGGSGKNLINKSIEPKTYTGDGTSNNWKSSFPYDWNSIRGKKVTFSFDAVSDVNSGRFIFQSSLSPYNSFSQTITASTTPRRYTNTTIVPDVASSSTGMQFRMDELVGNVTISNAQLEIGDTETALELPAPTPDYPIAINSLNNVDVVSSVGKENLFTIKDIATGYKDSITSLERFRAKFWATQIYNNNWVKKKLEPNKEYTIRFKAKVLSKPSTPQNNAWATIALNLYSSSRGSFAMGEVFQSQYSTMSVGSEIEVVKTFTTPSYVHELYVLAYCPRHDPAEYAEIEFSELTLVRGKDGNDYSPSPEDIRPDTPNSTIYKTNISLPEPLRSVGDVKDRLFRDSDGLWKVERNVGQLYLGEDENWYLQEQTTNHFRWVMNSDRGIFFSNSNSTAIMSNSFPTTTMNAIGALDGEAVALHSTFSGSIQIKVLRSRVSGSTSPTVFKDFLKNLGMYAIYIKRTPTIETLPDDLQQKLNNIHSYGATSGNVFSTKIPYEVNLSFQGYKMKLKPNRAYTMTTNIPDSSGVNFHTFISTGEVSPSHQLNGVSVNYPRTINTDSNGDVSVAVRLGAINDGFQSRIYWIRIQEAPVTNYVYTVVRPNHYEENLLTIFPVLKDYWYSNVAPLDVPTVSTGGNSATEVAIPVFPNQQLLFEKQTTEGDTYWRIVWVNSRGEVVSRETPNTNSITMTAPAGAYGMRVSFPTESQASIKYASHAFLPNSYTAQQLQPTLYATFKTEMWSRNWKLENYTKTEIRNRVPIGQMIENIKKDPATARLTGERLHFTGDVLFDKSFHDKLFAESIFTNTLDAREISAGRVKTGMLQSKNGLSNLNMDNGTFSFGNGKIIYDGNNLVLNVDTLQIKSSSVPTASQAQGYANSAKNEAISYTEKYVGKIFRAYGISYSYRGNTTNPFDGGRIIDEKGNSITPSSDRSYLLAVIDKNDNVVYSNTFDVYTSVSNAKSLSDKLNEYDKSYLIILVGSHAPAQNRLSNNLPSTLYSFGASREVFVDEDWDSGHAAYLLVGRKGIGEGNGYEVFSSYPNGGMVDVLVPIKNGATSLISGDNTIRKLANSAQGTANTANTNATNAKSKTDAWTFTGTTEINGGKIRADTITAAQIKAGSITSNEIQAGAITADRIAIGDFTNYAAWGKTAQTLPLSRGSLDTTVYRSSKGSIKLAPGETSATLRPEVEVVAGEEIYFEFWIKTDSNWNGTGDNSKIRFGNQTGALLYSAPYNGVKTSWTKYTGGYKVASSVYSLQISFGNSGSAGNIWIDDIIIRKKTNGSMIVDGTITTTELAANSVTTAKIATNAVTANEIAAGTITAKEIAANSLTIGNLDSSTTNKINNAVTSSDVTTAILSDKQVKDTRATNQPPNWYWTTYPRQSVQEFKQRASIGAPGTQQFGVLTTDVPWSGSSGGYITQTFRSGDGVYTRTGITTSWTGWSQLDLESRINNAVTTIDGTGITVKDGSFYLMDTLSNLKYSVVSKDNLIVDHSFEMSTNGGSGSTYYLNPESQWQTVGNPTVVQGDGVVLDSYLGRDVPKNEFGQFSVNVNASNYVRGYVKLKSNTDYTLSVFFRSPVGTSTTATPVIRVHQEDYRGGTWEIGTYTLSPVGPDKKHFSMRQSCTFLAFGSRGGVQADLLFDIKTSNSNWVNIDGIQLVEGNTPTNYDPETGLWSSTRGSVTSDVIKSRTFRTVGVGEGTGISFQQQYNEKEAGIFTGYMDALTIASESGITMLNPVTFEKGIESVIIPSTADLNNYFGTGYYYTPTTADAKLIKNTPINTAFSLQVQKHAGTVQIVNDYQAHYPRMFYRNYYNGTWGKWRQIATRTHTPMIQSGEVWVTTTPNTMTGVNVTFDVPFPTMPRIVVTAHSGANATRTTTVNYPSNTGFTASVFRTDSVSTRIFWIAVEDVSSMPL